MLIALYYWSPALAWMALIFYQSSRPVPEAVGSIPDCFPHMGEYFVLTALLFRALNRGFRGARALIYLSALSLSTIYGFSDELHQSFVPFREPSIIDLLFDFIGSSLALLCICGYNRIGARKS